MKGIEKTKEQLIDELAILRQQITELQKSEIKHRQIEESLLESEENIETLFPVSISGSNIVIDGQVKGVISTYIDITKRKKLEEKLKKLAHTKLVSV